MKSILLISHGQMAEGVKSAVSLIADATMVETLGLMPNDDPEKFRVEIEKKIESMNNNNGVVIFADLLGGSPANQAAYFCLDEKYNVDVIVGMNLPMILEFVTINQFMDDIDLETIINVGKEGIVHLNQILNNE